MKVVRGSQGATSKDLKAPKRYKPPHDPKRFSVPVSQSRVRHFMIPINSPCLPPSHGQGMSCTDMCLKPHQEFHPASHNDQSAN